MEVESEFSVEKFRDPDETQATWCLRKAFLETHYDKFPTDRLVCLAKCFINVEVDGCKYPNQVMIQLAELKRELNL